MDIKKFNKLKLPEVPGIYFFRDFSGFPIYIGRATSLYDRVKSYFSADLIQSRGILLIDMVKKSKTVDYIETDSVLEAILLESSEIKKYQPYYNTKEKDNRSYNFVVITDEEFPRLISVRGRELDKLDEKELGYKIKYQFGPYPTGSLLKDALKIIRKIFPYRDEKAKLKHQESFYHALGLSPDTTSPDAKKEYQKTIRNLVLFFQGKKKELINILKREMDRYAKTQDFEKAKKIRDTIYALTHIQDISLIKDDKNLRKDEIKLGESIFRIEAYDISHFSGKDVVGVMTVIEDDEINKNEYRKFKIKVDKNDDTGALKEVLSRRFKHTEWCLPNLIVIDGGLGQINTAKDIIDGLLKEISYDIIIKIKIVSVMKDSKHKPDHILGDESIVKTYMKSILLANAEAHRFSIAYQKSLRTKRFIK